MKDQPSLTIQSLQERIGRLLQGNLSLFEGLTISGVSIDKPLEAASQWRHSFFTGTSSEKNKNYSVKLRIPNQLIKQYLQETGEEPPNGARYDITIESISILSYGQISITAKRIKETGISEREILNRKLARYAREKGYLGRPKKPLPRLITSILAITSRHSGIQDDLLANLMLREERVHIAYCENSKEIARYIAGAQKKSFDIIVLYRGGHQDSAMGIFSSEEILDAVAQSDVPVCAALGHDIDMPFIYNVADLTYSTPSAFGKAIANYNHTAGRTERRELYRAIGDTLTEIAKKVDRDIVTTLEGIEKTIQFIHTQKLSHTKLLSSKIEGSVATISQKATHTVFAKHEEIKTISNSILTRKTNDIESCTADISHTTQKIGELTAERIEKLLLQVESAAEKALAAKRNIDATREEKRSQKKLTLTLLFIIFLLLLATGALLVVK